MPLPDIASFAPWADPTVVSLRRLPMRAPVHMYDSVDLARFSVVDVSAEPLDGDPTHSGDSIVRGALDV